MCGKKCDALEVVYRRKLNVGDSKNPDAKYPANIRQLVGLLESRSIKSVKCGRLNESYTILLLPNETNLT